MNALILVGGEGTRLRPLTYDTPKPMLPIVELPIIARIVEWLAMYGVEHAVLSLGYKPNAFLEAFPNNEWAGVTLAYAVEPSPLDTAGAIRFAAEDSGYMDEPLVIVNGDILTDLNLDELTAFHHDRGGQATIALTPVEDPSAFGVVPTNPDGSVIAFVEKPPKEEAPTNLINAGTYIFEPSVLQRIETGRRVSVEREIFPAMVADKQLFAMASDAYWVDTGSPERYIKSQLDVLNGLRPNVIFPAHNHDVSGIRIASDAVVAGKLSGSVFVAANARIEAGASVTNSVIGEGCEVLNGAVVTGSVLLPGARVAENAICSDSIIGLRALVDTKSEVSDLSVIGTDEVIAAGTQHKAARIPQ